MRTETKSFGSIAVTLVWLTACGSPEHSGAPAPGAKVGTVLPCDGVAAGSGWERITPPGDLGDTQAIALDPFAPGTIYVQMHKGGNGHHAPTDGIYASADCGSTWNAGRWLVYDQSHHLLYSSSWGDGLYRLATE